uniref:Vta1/callose synthase N-terminal domain-containing protein n=1 Tax=Chromera velia CCMP2878 TaxID=1169474 RepID=A0A0G4H7B3_9ALVE|mmetsp:Transcript_17942/g.36451  ORF Transcript_17942/g.36451 Transcript_17942/m.36451 type:complete len:313 (+) Transcript_17942:184-1122(+)|eukprot:Cvel_24907.t1-p1 / transcript=Cvel_24907.t1 / gene=Cvel_24907 / organism=Chromera_velia_CCMP2878 / gene_product=Vacuolar protein sorting-associated protein VTA1, putative / transcript_product=Vacuolar protein sorting-associated protein VTA1, putative / location=Cvel_scaffold2755:2762-7001(-) / protein_length=312 / sequence_SO=supercontig / SO=protein_coding / is_pseudo=false
MLTQRKDVPEGARAFVPYINRGEELEHVVPHASFYCFKFAAEQLAENRAVFGTQPGYIDLLIKMLDKAEALKPHGEQAGTQAEFESFCLDVFAKADDEDRKGQVNLGTVRTYYSASLFIDVLQQFGPLAPDWLEKRKWAKWRATYLKKCIDQGVTPDPPPRKEGAEDELEAEFAALGLPSVPEGTGGGDIDLPSVPAGFAGEGASRRSSASASAGPSQQGGPSPPPLHPAASEPPAAASVPGPSQGDSVAPTVSDPGVSVKRESKRGGVSRQDMKEAEKLASWAISALSFNDVDNAVQNLKDALKHLGHPVP